jgi:hypothetical protein
MKDAIGIECRAKPELSMLAQLFADVNEQLLDVV